jgi:hypothetical protein
MMTTMKNNFVLLFPERRIIMWEVSGSYTGVPIIKADNRLTDGVQNSDTRGGQKTDNL